MRTLEKEKYYLDKHSDNVTMLQLRLRKLISASTKKIGDPAMLARKLLRLERKPDSTSSDIDSMHDDPDPSVVELYNEQLHDDKKALSSIYDDILDLDLSDLDDLLIRHPDIDCLNFSCRCKVKKLCGFTSSGTSAAAVADAKGLKLPQLDIPHLTVIFSIGPSSGSSSPYRFMSAKVCLMLKSLSISNSHQERFCQIRN